MTKNKSTNLELLRIIAMIMIVMLHYLSYGGGSDNKLYSNILREIAIIGSNLFVLITGYFSVSAKGSSVNWKKIIRIWLTAIFYSWGIYIILYINGFVNFGFDSIYSLFPILTGEYWYVTIYLLLCLLMPYLNIFVKSLDKQQFKKLILTLVFIYSVWSWVPYFLEIGVYHGYSLIWFIVLYFIASYLRLHGEFINKIKTRYFLISYLCITTIMILLSYILEKFDSLGLKGISSNLSEANGLFCLISSISFFIIFIKLKVSSKLNKLILFFSSLTLRVYFIHMQVVLKSVLWSKLLNVSSFSNSNYFIVYSILIVLMVYLICSIIEFIRQTIFKYISSIVTKKFDKKEHL